VKLVDRLIQVLARVDLWAIDHLAQPVVTCLADAGIGKFTLARGLIPVAVVAGWASTAWRLSLTGIAVANTVRDVMLAMELALPPLIGLVYWTMIRIEQGRDINVWMRPIAHLSWAPARLLWACCVASDLAAAVWLMFHGIPTNMWLYAIYHGALLSVGYVLATRKRPPAQMRQRVPAGAKAGPAH